MNRLSAISRSVKRKHVRKYGFLALGISIFWGVSFLGCGPLKKSSTGSQRQVKQKGPFNLQTAQRNHDTLAIREFLAGDWTLDKMCHSGFAGLKCDTSIQQNWRLDSLGGISWVTEADAAGKDQYHFVPRTGNQAGTAAKDTAWVLFLNQAHRGYLIRTLTRDSLSLSEYPLMMDNTTTYYLSR